MAETKQVSTQQLSAIITPTQVTGLILSGGQGRRVGCRDKGLLQRHGVTLIEHQLAWLSSQVSTQIISANRYLERYRQLDAKVVSDGDSEFHGPLNGILSAMAELNSEWLFVVPVDLPDLPDDLISQFCSAIKAPANAYYITSAVRAHYLLMLVHRSQRSSLQAFFEAGHRRVRDFLQRVGAQAIDPGFTEMVYKNYNELVDFDAIDIVADGHTPAD